jgi:hypothetical protein
MTEAADLVSQRGKCDDPVSLKLVAPMETPFASSSSADSASPSAPLHLTQQAIARLFARTTRTNQSRLLSVPRKCEPIQIDPVRTPLRDNQDHPASAGKHRARPGLPPALLLVLTPIRKRLASREFCSAQSLLHGPSPPSPSVEGPPSIANRLTRKGRHRMQDTGRVIVRSL